MAEGGHQSAGDGLGGDGNGLAYGVAVGSPVPDNADSVHAQQWRAPVLAIVQPSLDTLKGGLQKSKGQKVEPTARQLFFDNFEHRLGGTFPRFEEHIAHEPIADNDIGDALKEGLALHITYKVIFQIGFEEMIGFFSDAIAFGGFLADVEQSDSWIGDFEDLGGVDLPHQSEIEQLARGAIDGGAAIEEHTASRVGRQDGGDSRTVYMGESAPEQFGDGTDSAGVAHRDEGVGFALFGQFGGDHQRGVAFASDCHNGGVVHRDDLRGVVEMQVWGASAFGQMFFDLFGIADQHDIEANLSGGFVRPQHNLLGSIVAPHRIDCNSHCLAVLVLVFVGD